MFVEHYTACYLKEWEPFEQITCFFFLILTTWNSENDMCQTLSWIIPMYICTVSILQGDGDTIKVLFDWKFLTCCLSFQQDGVLHSVQTGLQTGLSDCVQVLSWMVSAKRRGWLSLS